MEKVKLNNGVEMPWVGLGVFRIEDNKEAEKVVRTALSVGYRHIDTAMYYHNEEAVGKAIRESGIPREEIFVTTKMWNADQRSGKVREAFEASIKRLDIDYYDLYLIHWPAIGNDGPEYNKETWRAFEKLYSEKRIRAIGVSNFKPHHLQALMEAAEVIPAVNQIEYRPGQMQHETVDFCRKYKILVEAWSPLGTGRMLTNLQLKNIAGQYEKSVAQLCIRWCLQNNALPLPKSVTPSRIKENTDVFDFEISPEDMELINALPYIGGSGLDPDKRNF